MSDTVLLGSWFWPVWLLAIVCSALASASETVMTRVNYARFTAHAARGNKRAKRLLNVLDNHIEDVIAAILLANNTFNVAVSSLSTAALIPLFGAQGLGIALVGVTLLLLIFAEILPKTIALRHADTLAPWIAPIALGLSWLATPLLWLVRDVTHAVAPDRDENGSSQRETLEGAIDLHAAESGDHQERTLLHSVLALKDIDVGEAMTHRSDVFLADAENPDVLSYIVSSSPHRMVPLYRGHKENIIGMIDLVDIVRDSQNSTGEHDNIDQADIRAIMQKPWFVPSTTTAQKQLRMFRATKRKAAIVIDEYGSFEGLVTVSDILDELFGEHEELDPDTEAPSDTLGVPTSESEAPRIRGVTPQPDGSWIINGDVSLRTLQREFDLTIDDEENNTIAGYVLSLAQVIPKVGDEIRDDQLFFTILERQRNRIVRLKLERPTRFTT